MCFRDLIQALNDEGIALTESQVRFALRTGKVAVHSGIGTFGRAPVDEGGSRVDGWLGL